MSWSSLGSPNSGPKGASIAGVNLKGMPSRSLYDQLRGTSYTCLVPDGAGPGLPQLLQID